MEGAGIEQCLHRLTFDFDCFDYVAHGLPVSIILPPIWRDLRVMSIANKRNVRTMRNR